MIQMDNALNILHSIPVAEPVTQARVLEGGSTRPDEGNEALVSIPGVDHIVQIVARGVNLEAVKLAVPERLQFFELLLYNRQIFVVTQNLRRTLLIILSQQEGDFFLFSRLQLHIDLQAPQALVL